MKKGKIRLIPLLFSAVIAGVLFYIVVRNAFSFFWGFDLLSQRHWNHILKKWQGGWVLRKPKEVLFFISLLLLLPGYFFTWFVVYVFPLKKVLLAPKTFLDNRKKAKLQEQSLAAALGPADKKLPQKTTEKKAPKPYTQKQAAIDHLRGKKVPEAMAATGSSAAEKPAVVNEAAVRFDLWQKLADKLEAAKISTLRHMQIHSFTVNLLAITAESVFLLCEGPEEGSQWEVNENTSPAIWKTENGEIPSPLRKMLNAKTIFEQYFKENFITDGIPKYQDLSINCCMILDHGNITNPDTLLEFLDKENISVLKMGSCKTAALPDTDALISFISSQGVSSSETNDAIAIAILDLTDV